MTVLSSWVGIGKADRLLLINFKPTSRYPVPMLLYAATTNPGKLRDFARAAASSPSIRIEPLPNLAAIPAPPEDEPTFEANARAKAIYYSLRAPSLLVLADDSGLEVAALDEPPVSAAPASPPTSPTPPTPPTRPTTATTPPSSPPSPPSPNPAARPVTAASSPSPATAKSSTPPKARSMASSSPLPAAPAASATTPSSSSRPQPHHGRASPRRPPRPQPPWPRPHRPSQHAQPPHTAHSSVANDSPTANLQLPI